MPHHGERHFLTDCENHMMMAPNKVEFTNSAGSMKWLTGIGFDISTGENITINADQDIIVNSQAQIDVSSPERITVNKTGAESSIDMIGGDLHISAEKNVRSTSKANKFKATKLPERTPGFAIDDRADKLVATVPKVSNVGK